MKVMTPRKDCNFHFGQHIIFIIILQIKVTNLDFYFYNLELILGFLSVGASCVIWVIACYYYSAKSLILFRYVITFKSSSFNIFQLYLLTRFWNCFCFCYLSFDNSIPPPHSWRYLEGIQSTIDSRFRTLTTGDKSYSSKNKNKTE